MIKSKDKVRPVAPKFLAAGIAATLLSGCADMQTPAFLQAATRAGGEETVARAARTVERDIEAPEIFQVTEAGLWDGRPSLGGVWVAHPDVEEPGRVIIRNESNGKFVIGALFRRERQSPGPRLQVSSDAAAAINMLAGQPVNLDVVALKREEVAGGADPVPLAAAAQTVPEAATVDTASLDPVTALASDALAAATAPAPVAAAVQPTAEPARPAPQTPREALSKPFIQVGIFSIEQNARNTATAMRQAGMVPTVKEHALSGKRYWRVVVGPALTQDERGALLEKIKGTGFSDAFAVGS